MKRARSGKPPLLLSQPKTHIGSSLIKIAKPSSVFILIGTGNPGSDTEYVSIVASDPSEV